LRLRGHRDKVLKQESKARLLLGVKLSALTSRIVTLSFNRRTLNKGFWACCASRAASTHTPVLGFAMLLARIAFKLFTGSRGPFHHYSLRGGVNMAYENYKLVRVEIRGKVAYATIDNPPVNLITRPLLEEFTRLSLELEADEELLVVVLRSANPDFFIAHFDVAAILAFPIDKPARHEDYANAFYHDMCERFRLMNMVTIAQIEGRVGGGGSELGL
jgi:hypothetical protein